MALRPRRPSSSSNTQPLLRCTRFSLLAARPSLLLLQLTLPLPLLTYRCHLMLLPLLTLLAASQWRATSVLATVTI
jgi:hypothetical protein